MVQRACVDPSRAHARYHRQRERMCRDAAGVRCFASHGTGRVMFGPSLRLNTLGASLITVFLRVHFGPLPVRLPKRDSNGSFGRSELPRALARSHASIDAHTMSAAPPAMSNVRPLDDVSNIIDLDASTRSSSRRGATSRWMARRELSMKEQVAVHKTNMAVAEEEYVSLVEREKDLAAAAEELAREAGVPASGARHAPGGSGSGEGARRGSAPAAPGAPRAGHHREG